MVESKQVMDTPGQLILIKGFLQTHEIDGGVVEELMTRVSLGLNLESLGIRKQTADAMIMEIVQGIYISSQFLRISCPDAFGLMTDDEIGVLPSGHSVPPLLPLATSGTTAECPNGVVNYSPFYLREVAKSIERGFEPIALSSLIETSFHEVYHLWQRKAYPRELERDRMIRRMSGKTAWKETWSEREADRFSFDFAAARIEISMPQGTEGLSLVESDLTFTE